MWWDEYGVPRYQPFAPWDQARIYSDEVAVLRVQCAGCRREFNVAVSTCPVLPSLQRMLDDGLLHYGCPPNVGCCRGAALQSSALFVAQFWRRSGLKWCRIPENEIDLREKIAIVRKQRVDGSQTIGNTDVGTDSASTHIQKGDTK